MEYHESKQIATAQLERLYTSVGWSSYTQNLEQLQQALEHSLMVVSVWDNTQLVGLIRAVGDGHTIVYIQDILIDPIYQNQGLGTTLMKTVLDRYRTVRQKVLLTEDAPDVRHFYEKFEFESCDKGQAVAFYREY